MHGSTLNTATVCFDPTHLHTHACRVDSNNCLHLKLTDPGHPWEYSDSFQRDGMYVEEEIRW